MRARAKNPRKPHEQIQMQFNPVRTRVAQRIGSRDFLHEYECPKCNALRLSRQCDINRSPLCKACGIVKHGLHKDPRYKAWEGMKSRCTNPNNRSAKHYLHRGITLCDEWQEFIGFMAWPGFNDWKPGLEIDRIDNNKGYGPENCRWVTRAENVRNRRVAKLTKSDVLEIRRMRSIGVKIVEIARNFGITEGYASSIASKRYWSDI